MKNRCFLFFISMLMIGFAFIAKGESNTKDTIDEEQTQLQLCFIYSNMLGFNIDRVENPLLYQGVNDWLGTPYRFSGNSKKGVDCSGLVCVLYKDCYGKDVTGCANDIYKSTHQIKRSDLREGDLVFFRIKKKRITHVGLYLGHNRFVHASLQNGVIVSNLDDPYYNKYFYRAGRINP
jgi:lipoprotein Spr